MFTGTTFWKSEYSPAYGPIMEVQNSKSALFTFGALRRSEVAKSENVADR